MSTSRNYRPTPKYQLLGPAFYDEVKPALFPKSICRFRNQRWAEREGLGELTDEEWIRHFALFQPLPGNLEKPLALRYHGHQFRSYNPDLGDGRGFLFAQLSDPIDGRLLDLGTKGSGQTPWSRAGDGRLTLKGAVREILATEMLEALGVYTSKSFSVIETGEDLLRHDEPSPTRSAVLVRLNHSHVRFGTFQRLAALGQKEEARRLVDYCIENFFQNLRDLQGPERLRGFFREVVLRSAKLAASWMIAGFVHGVLNTDNMNITGESFDYGPYRFAPDFTLDFTAAYFDHSGLYAYGRQPEAVYWNLQQLGSSLQSLAPEVPLLELMEGFADAFNHRMTSGFLERLGLQAQNSQDSLERDMGFLSVAFAFLAESKVGLERFYFDFYGGSADLTRCKLSCDFNLYSGETFARFMEMLASYQPSPEAPIRLQDPYFKQIQPCSLLIGEIESLWAAISEREDWQPLHQKIEAIRAMGKVFGHGL